MLVIPHLCQRHFFDPIPNNPHVRSRHAMTIPHSLLLVRFGLTAHFTSRRLVSNLTLSICPSRLFRHHQKLKRSVPNSREVERWAKTSFSTRVMPLRSSVLFFSYFWPETRLGTDPEHQYTISPARLGTFQLCSTRMCISWLPLLPYPSRPVARHFSMVWGARHDFHDYPFPPFHQTEWNGVHSIVHLGVCCRLRGHGHPDVQFAHPAPASYVQRGQKDANHRNQAGSSA